jgi:ribosomal-protein-alanine N-acetyltransferase
MKTRVYNAASVQAPKPSLRDYGPGDLDALYELDRACFPPGISYSKRMLRYFLAQPGAICIVAESGGSVAGFLLAESEGSTGHIITLDITAEQRRRGLGSALLEKAERRLATRGVREVEIETATENEAGVAFWHRHGYRDSGVLRGYYLGRHDAYAMRKRLAP